MVLPEQRDERSGDEENRSNAFGAIDDAHIYT